MAQAIDPAQEQNISDVLQMLKQSYPENESNQKATETSEIQDDVDVMSDEDLKKLLKMQYIDGDDDTYSEQNEDSYSIDQEFLAEAESAEAVDEEVEEVEEEVEEAEEELEEAEVELEEELEEEFDEEIFEELDEDVDEETSDIEYLEQMDDDDDSPLTPEEIEMLKRFSEEVERSEEEEISPYEESIGNQEKALFDDDEDDLTFDQLPVVDTDDGIVFEELPLDVAVDDEDDITFEELENTLSAEKNDGDIVYTPIILDETLEEQAREDNDVVWYEEEQPEKDMEDVIEKIEEPVEVVENFESLTQDAAELSKEDDTLLAYSVSEVVSSVEQEEIQDPDMPEDAILTDSVGDIEDVLEEFSVVGEERPKYKVSSADLALLLQLGCDEEIFEIVSDDDIENIAMNDSINSIPTDDGGVLDGSESKKEPMDALEDKIISVYEGHSKERGAIFIRMMVTAIMCGVLLIYDGLPLLNVHLPGIMDRKEFFLSYVLIGLQLLVICLIPSAKQLYVGAKRLFTRRANTYSIVLLLFVALLGYDIALTAVKAGTPHVFHFLLGILTLAAIVFECLTKTAEINTFKFFFKDIIDRAQGEAIVNSNKRAKSFTLKKSAGKNSTAEKMYCGGLDPSQNIYYPISVDSAAGYFNAIQKSSKKQDAPLLMILPSLVISIIAGIIVLMLPSFEGDAWISFGTVLVSLFLTLPISAFITIWLPFGAFNTRGMKEGFAFACEASTEGYSDCNMLVFKDMHVFEKCSPKNVNLAIYDATQKSVLIGCLDALYSAIGGPLADSFSVGEAGNTIGECRLNRVAKIGVEAVVGSNYSMLVGNEQFMSRYGISFPTVNFKNKGDEIYSLCVSINGRASARIIVKYKINEMFEMFASRLREDGIYCVLETFDPMISSELLSRLRYDGAPPISVVHLDAEQYRSSVVAQKEGIFFDIDNEDMGVLAKNSRLNLVVAASGAKRMSSIRKRANISCYLAGIFGTFIVALSLIFNWTEQISEFYLLGIWLLTGAASVAITLLSLPKKNRFTLESYIYDQSVKKARTSK